MLYFQCWQLDSKTAVQVVTHCLCYAGIQTSAQPVSVDDLYYSIELLQRNAQYGRQLVSVDDLYYTRAVWNTACNCKP